MGGVCLLVCVCWVVVWRLWFVTVGCGLCVVVLDCALAWCFAIAVLFWFICVRVTW